jgi:hypothetical protein
VVKRNAYRRLVEKPEGKRPLGKPKNRWMDLREMGYGGMDWIDLVQVPIYIYPPGARWCT